jgi:secreted trypsin-like serine protease
MQKLKRFFLLFSLLTAGFAAHTSLAQEGRAIAKIINGTRISSSRSSVVKVLAATRGGSDLCTGTVLSSTAVLTAWHCVARKASSMSVIVGRKRIAVRSIRIHPNVNENRDTGAVYNDIAILHLKSRISVASIALLISKKIAVGGILTLVGYGQDEFGRAGMLKKGFTAVDGVDSNFVYTHFDQNESNTCFGDSGGPALFSYKDASGRTRTGIVGVTSTGTSDTCGYGDEGEYINLQSPLVRNFILKEVPNARSS